MISPFLLGIHFLPNLFRQSVRALEGERKRCLSSLESSDREEEIGKVTVHGKEEAAWVSGGRSEESLIAF